MPATNASNNNNSSKNTNNATSLRDSIDALRVKLNSAISAQEFEKCAAIRDEIKKLEAELTIIEEATVEPFPETEYNTAINKYEGKMKDHIAAEEFEKCATIRDSKKKLEALKTKYDTANSNAEKKLIKAEIVAFISKH